MADLSTTTTPALLDRLDDLAVELAEEPQAGELVESHLRRLEQRLREIGLIHIELAKRTATGWRPL